MLCARLEHLIYLSVALHMDIQGVVYVHLGRQFLSKEVARIQGICTRSAGPMGLPGQLTWEIAAPLCDGMRFAGNPYLMAHWEMAPLSSLALVSIGDVMIDWISVFPWSAL